MIYYLGPLILGFLLGFIIGTRIKPTPKSKLKFDKEVYAVVVIIAIIIAWYQGPFPYYQDLPLASGFLAGLVGIILGKLTFGR